MFRLVVKVNKRFCLGRFQSTIQHGLPSVGQVSHESLPGGDVKDMSVHGLCLSSLKVFFSGLISGSKSTSIVPALGR
jgi:hypothetical protein